MKFSHREDKRGDRLLDVLTDEANGLRLIVSRVGAEMISLVRRDSNGNWVGFLHRDNEMGTPATGWANHATVMGYYLHRIKNERTLYRGQEIRGGTHSFLRQKSWHRIDSAAENELTYRITPEDFAVNEYPLKVSLDLTYRIDGPRIRVSFRFTNAEPELTAHVAFGLHPGFAAASFASFRFLMPAGIYRRHFSPENYLSGETEEINFGGGEMPFPREKLPGSYILEFVDVPGREFVYRDQPSGRSVVFDFQEVPYLTLWSDGGPFLCVEPCWGLTDHHEQRAFENKEGIQTIAPGGKLIAGFSMEPRVSL
jgi:galactose mutarotase-like enzyme